MDKKLGTVTHHTDTFGEKQAHRSSLLCIQTLDIVSAHIERRFPPQGAVKLREVWAVQACHIWRPG